LISALITIVVLVLGPGLAYGQSPAWLLRAASKSMRASVRAVEAGWLQSSLTGLRVSTLTESGPAGCVVASTAGDRVNSLHSSNPSVARPPSDPRRRWVKHSSKSSLAFVAGPQLRFTASPESILGWSSGGAGLHPSVLKTVQPWLRGGYLDGGAGDPADNKHGSFDPVFSLRLPLEFQSSSLSFIGGSGSLNRLFTWPFVMASLSSSAFTPAVPRGSSGFSSLIIDSEEA
jgi:hypothetical protein